MRDDIVAENVSDLMDIFGADLKEKLNYLQTEFRNKRLDDFSTGEIIDYLKQKDVKYKKLQPNGFKKDKIIIKATDDGITHHETHNGTPAVASFDNCEAEVLVWIKEKEWADNANWNNSAYN